MKITTEGGTACTDQDGNVTITRQDKPEVTVPEDDLEEFFDEWLDNTADVDLEADE